MTVEPISDRAIHDVDVRPTGRRRIGRALRELQGEPSDRLFALYAATRDTQVRDELLQRHAWVARACASQMRRQWGQLDELEQVALIGVYKALERFDLSFGVQFRTYASATALGELRRYYRDCGWSVRVPRRMKELSSHVQHATTELTATLGRSPTTAEIATWLRVTVEDVLEAHEAGAAMHANDIDAERFADRSGNHIDDDDPQIAAHIDAVDAHVAIRRMMVDLHPQTRQVVLLRFFGDLTQQEIATMVGVSQVQVSRLLRAAITQMRETAHASGASAEHQWADQ